MGEDKSRSRSSCWVAAPRITTWPSSGSRDTNFPAPPGNGLLSWIFHGIIYYIWNISRNIIWNMEYDILSLVYGILSLVYGIWYYSISYTGNQLWLKTGISGNIIIVETYFVNLRVKMGTKRICLFMILGSYSKKPFNHLFWDRPHFFLFVFNCALLLLVSGHVLRKCFPCMCFVFLLIIS